MKVRCGWTRPIRASMSIWTRPQQWRCLAAYFSDRDHEGCQAMRAGQYIHRRDTIDDAGLLCDKVNQGRR